MGVSLDYRKEFGWARRVVVLGIAGFALIEKKLFAASDSRVDLSQTFHAGKESSLAENPTFLIVVGLLSVGTMALFGYLYWRDWKTKRQYDELLKANENSQATAVPIVAKARRKPLIKSSQPRPHDQKQTLQGAGIGLKGQTRAPGGIKGRRAGAAEAAEQPCGILNVCSDSGQEEIYVNHRLAAKAPASLSLTEGRHVVEVKRKGYRSYRRQVKIVAGSEVRMRPVLVKQAAGHLLATEASPTSAAVTSEQDPLAVSANHEVSDKDSTEIRDLRN